MMNKKIIIDLDGVIFEPVRESFSRVARSEYGNIKAVAVIAAYKYGIGRVALRGEVANVLHKCAIGARVRPGAMDALKELGNLSWVTVEFCSQVAFPENAKDLELHYRSIAPAMNVAHYELISPFESKRDYLYKSTGMDRHTLNYVIDSQVSNIKWPARWRTTPILLNASAHDASMARALCGARSFQDLNAFKEFLLDQQHVR
ncbi:hypothetical protein HDR61_01070 [bacterium]|nr:hypothetical protein [bacterium]